MRYRYYSLYMVLVLSLSGLVSLNQSLFASSTVQTMHAPSRLLTEANAAPDLVIENLTVTPPTPTAGAEVTINFIVKNVGDATAANGYRVYVYIAPADEPPTPSTPTTIPPVSYFIPFPAGAANPHGITRPGADVPVNNPKIYVWVDRDNQVAESNENNNVAVYPPSSPPGTPDIYDQDPPDDNACADAKEITTDGAEQARNFVPPAGATKDEDWIKFTADSGVEYHVEIISTGSNADAELELRAACDGAPSLGSKSEITFTAPMSGTFYLHITNQKEIYGADTDYKAKVTANTGCAAYYEANNSCAVAGDLPMTGAAQEHTFCQTGDIDWTRLAVVAGATYVITATNAGAQANVQMSLYGSCDSNATTAQGTQSLQFTAPSAGYYFLKTENANRTQFGPATKYTLQSAAVGQPGCQEDSFEQDDNLATAQALATTGITQTHNTCPVADLDWVKFDAVAGTTYTIETLNLRAKADTIICLHDSNGTQLLCNDDSGPGYGSRIVWQAGAAGVYYVRIRDYDPQVAGPLTQYDIHISTAGCTTDAFEADNLQVGAKPLAIGNTMRHNICPQNDQDWVSFNVTPGLYTIETLEVGPEADTIIELYDSAGNRLAQNDDHTPGITSQVSYNFTAAGAYFVRTRLFNATNYGAGTEYSLKVTAGGPPPTPVPPTPTPPTPEPEQNQTGPRTLILVHRTQLAKLYSEAQATQVINKLGELAARSEISGTLIRLENNTTVAGAYDAWLADQTNVEKANQVASTIRQLVMGYLSQFSGVQFVVLVGDDRVIPFRRIADYTPRQSERTYKDVSANHPTGAAIQANYYLTDDYYVDREPTPHQGRELYLPDLAIGRLIETPEDMIGLIDAFMAAPVLDNYNVLITGYDFVQDVARENCQLWKSDLDGSKVDCGMIGDSWLVQDFRARQVNGDPKPFKIQSINGHAAHYAEGAPNNASIFGTDLVGAIGDLRGGLIYTLGCHSGLNVPPSNSVNPVDLAEAFARKQANYIANTGYGWGLRYSVGLSEKLMKLFTNELLKGTQGSMGQSLVKAKSLYFQQDNEITPHDEKVIQQLIYYGLPMFKVVTSGALSNENEFPNVGFNPQLPAGSLGTETISVTIPINFAAALGDPTETAAGQYVDLDQHVTDNPEQPIQPLFFGDVTTTAGEARGVVLRNATYTTQPNFNPVVAAPYNEYVTDPAETQLDPTAGWYPSSPVDVTHHNGQSLLVTQAGQYDAQSSELRLYQDVQVDVYYSTSADQGAPEILVVDGLYNQSSNQVTVKVGATDPAGIKEVVVAYVQDVTATSGVIKSLNLRFDASSQKWVGSFTGDGKSRFYVQVVDQAGNRATATNKGNHYAPAEGDILASACNGSCPFYLPLVRR